MCLETVDEKIDLTDLKKINQHAIIAWKIVRHVGKGKFSPQYWPFFENEHIEFQLKKQSLEKAPEFDIKASQINTYYKRGFHFYKKFPEDITLSSYDLIMKCLVPIKAITSTGMEFMGQKAIVANRFTPIEIL